MMMTVMGYVLSMYLDENPRCIVPPPNIQGRFEGGADQDCGEQIEFHTACSVMHD
jgi:hypothetical protein